MSNQVSTLSMSKEFKKTPIGEIPVEWQLSHLSEVAAINMGQSPPSSDCNEEEEGLPFYQGNADFGEKYPSPRSWCRVPKKTASNGDILVSVRAPVGEVNVAPHECCIGRGLAAIRGSEVDGNYLFWVMRFLSPYLVKLGQGSTFDAINSKELSTLPVPVPSVTEQKKIAEILSAVDDAIQKTEAVTEKVNLLLNQLIEELVYKGTKKPNGRLKKTTIGKVPAHWNVLPLQEVADIERGKFQHRPRNEPRFYGGPYPFIQTGDVTNSKGRINRYSQTLNEEGLKISRLFPKGTILITIAANIGETAIAEFDVAFPDSIIGILAKDRIDNRYLEFYLRTRKAHLNGMSTESAQKNINLETLRPYLIPVPPLDEQREIVNIISTVNHNLELEVGTANELGSMKQALMQMLLTGKVRL